MNLLYFTIPHIFRILLLYSITYFVILGVFAGFGILFKSNVITLLQWTALGVSILVYVSGRIIIRQEAIMKRREREVQSQYGMY